MNVVPADDALIHDGEGKILGNGFVVDHILRGETMADVLGRSQHSVSAVITPLSPAHPTFSNGIQR